MEQSYKEEVSRPTTVEHDNWLKYLNTLRSLGNLETQNKFFFTELIIKVLQIRQGSWFGV